MTQKYNHKEQERFDQFWEHFPLDLLIRRDRSKARKALTMALVGDYETKFAQINGQHDEAVSQARETLEVADTKYRKYEDVLEEGLSLNLLSEKLYFRTRIELAGAIAVATMKVGEAVHDHAIKHKIKEDIPYKNHKEASIAHYKLAHHFRKKD